VRSKTGGLLKHMSKMEGTQAGQMTNCRRPQFFVKIGLNVVRDLAKGGRG